MEVLLPHNFNKNLLVVDPTKYGMMPGSRVGFTIKINGSTVTYNSTRHNCGTCISLIGSHFSGDPVRCSHREDMPEKAIYTTIRSMGSRSNNASLYNLTDRLLTVLIHSDMFSVFPRAEYCVIQCEEFTKAYKLNLIVDYPQPKSALINHGGGHITNQPDENYPNTIRQLLEERNPKYNGEQNYQLIQRQVLLARMFGNTNIQLKEFQELLLVDSAALNSGIMALVKEMNITLYSCEFVNRINLLRTFHGKVFASISTIAPSGLIQAFSSDIEKLKQMSLLVEKLLLHESNISALKARVLELEKENTELKVINAKQSIELETTNVTKEIMDKLISENNSYKSTLIAIKDKVNFLGD